MSGNPPAFLQPQFIMPLGMIVLMYFLLIRPQQQQAKKHADMLKKLEKNDEVITAGGVHATVVSVGDKTATIRIADNVRVEIEKNSITQVTSKK